MMDLIHKCIDNYPQGRAHANEIVGRLTDMVVQFPSCFANRLELLRQIKVVKCEKEEEGKRKDEIIQALTEKGEKSDRVIQQKKGEILLYEDKVQILTREEERKDEIIQQMESQLSSYNNRLQAMEKQKAAEIDELRVTYFSEVEQLQLQLRDLSTQNQLTRTENEAEIIQLKSVTAVYETQKENDAKSLLRERRQFDIHLTREREHYESQLADLREQLMKEREMVKKLMEENHSMQTSLSLSESEIEMLKAEIAIKGSSSLRKDCELQARSKALEEKDAIISAMSNIMSEQLTKTRECLATTKQVSIL